MSNRNSPTPLKLQQKLYLPAMLFAIANIILVALMPLFDEVGMANEKTADTIGLWVNFFGKLHPLILHLPIGALSLVFLMEIAGILTLGKYKPNTTLGLFFAASTGVFAVVFGYCLYLTGAYSDSALIQDHKRDGILFSLLLLIVFMIKYTLDLKLPGKMFKGVYFSSLAASGLLMVSAGHHGGEISHGDPIDSLPSNVLAKRTERERAPVITDPVVFTSIIQPILEEKCVSCHGEDKQKGALRLDSYAAMLKGGEYDDCLVPGDTEGSALVSYLYLPEDDDLHMPPQGKTQMTKEEIQILDWWVKIGAPETATRSEVAISKSIEKALASLLTPAQKARMEEAKKAELAAKLATDKKKRAQLVKSFKIVNEKFPGSLKYVSQENTDLSFSAVSYRSVFGDDDIEILSTVFNDIIELDLSATQITDASATILSQFTKLKKIKLNENNVSDKVVETLAAMPQLEVINLYGTSVTDEGVKLFHDHPNLNRIYVWNTEVTAAAAEELENALEARISDEETDEKHTNPQVIMGINTTMIGIK